MSPPTAGATSAAMSGLIGRDRDRRPDTTPSQIFTIGPGGIGLIAQDPVRASTRLPASELWNRDCVEHGRHLWAVTGLTAGE